MKKDDMDYAEIKPSRKRKGNTKPKNPRPTKKRRQIKRRNLDPDADYVP